MNDITTIADHASQQSDRWLFIFTVIVLLSFGLIVWRWVTADREKLANRLTEITDRHIASQEKVTDVVANNTNALREVRDVINHCRK